MKNNVYEAPKAVLYNVDACDVITTSGGTIAGPLFEDGGDVLKNGWLSASDLVD